MAAYPECKQLCNAWTHKQLCPETTAMARQWGPVHGGMTGRNSGRRGQPLGSSTTEKEWLASESMKLDGKQEF